SYLRQEQGMGRLEGKTAIITGSASGFGEGMAMRFAEEGARIVVADLNGLGAERVAEAIGRSAIAMRADVTSRKDIDALVDAAMKFTGRVDIMVNNAGFTHRKGPLDLIDEDNFDLIAAVNMKAIYYSTLAVLPVMRKQGSGCI